MKNFWISFVKRDGGCMGRSGNLCIVWACLWQADVMQKLEMGEAILSVASSLVMAFMPVGFRSFISWSSCKSDGSTDSDVMLYVDYLGIYLLMDGCRLMRSRFYIDLCGRIYVNLNNDLPVHRKERFQI